MINGENFISIGGNLFTVFYPVGVRVAGEG